MISEERQRYLIQHSMWTKFEPEKMVMTTGNVYEGFERTDRGNAYGGFERTDRANLEMAPEPYRCPVSTPLHGKRPPQQKIPQSLTFVSLDFNNVKSSKKHVHIDNTKKTNELLKQKNSHLKLPRARNFEYYYVDKKFQKRIARHSNTRWLRALVAQPVDEIFGKYRVQTEVKHQHDSMTRTVSTPGERAILEAWESNSTRRLGSATSRSSKRSEFTHRTVSPQLTIITKSYNRTQESSRNDSRMDSRIDAVPHPPSPGGTAESSRAPSRTRNHRETVEFAEPIPCVSDSFYNQFQRKETKFPEIRDKKTTPLMGKQRKYLNNGYQNKKDTANEIQSPISPYIFLGPPPPPVHEHRHQQRTFTLFIGDENKATLG